MPKQIFCAIGSVDSRLDARLHTQPTLDTAMKPWRSIAVLTDLAAQRAELAKAQYHYGLHSPNAEVRRFRTQLASCWGIDKSFDELQRLLTQLEDAVRTTSTLGTQGLVQILSVYGLPFFISNGITTALGPWIDAVGKGSAALLKVVVYLILATALDCRDARAAVPLGSSWEIAIQGGDTPPGLRPVGAGRLKQQRSVSHAKARFDSTGRTAPCRAGGTAYLLAAFLISAIQLDRFIDGDRP